MDFERILASITRHWKVVLAILVLTVIAVVIVPTRVSPDYEVEGAAIILPPATTLGPNTNLDEPVSPWSRLSVNEEKAAVAMVEVLNGPEVADNIYEDPAVSDYSATTNVDNPAILSLSVVASDGDSALDGFDRLVQNLKDQLESRQEFFDTPDDTWLEASVLTQPTEAAEQPGSKIRAMLATGILGLVVAVGVAISLDVIVEPRRRRRAAEEAEDADEEAAEDDAEAANESEPQKAPSTLVLRRTADNSRP
jgi:capsular polysaccharide biosynthesis protein